MLGVWESSQTGLHADRYIHSIMSVIIIGTHVTSCNGREITSYLYFGNPIYLYAHICIYTIHIQYYLGIHIY